jgi:alpha-1,6-mannosyltransferase
VADRDVLADLLATADVVLAPGPVETFGLAALEALASGTAVVASADSALPEVIGDEAGRTAVGEGPGYADAVLDLIVRPRADRQRAARRRAERYPWSASVAGFLTAHDRHPSDGPDMSADARMSGSGYVAGS